MVSPCFLHDLPLRSRTYPEHRAGDKLMLDKEDAVAAEVFRKKIDKALSPQTSNALLRNWIMNTIGSTR